MTRKGARTNPPSGERFSGRVRKGEPSSLDTGLVLLDNVQFIYELALARLELLSFGAQFEIVDGFRDFKLHKAEDEPQLRRRLAYFKSVNGSQTDYSRIIQKNRTRSVNQYLTHWIYPYQGKFHPQMIRALLNIIGVEKGETVLDLGAGAGFDCFLAANKVGEGGKVIGVDMTPEMIEKARKNAEKGNYKNVDFRLGEIENLPVADNSVDGIISNCVINLSPDKGRVFREAFRVLKPGGRLMVSDITLLKELPDLLKNSIAAYVGCISGALLKNEYIGVIREVGFREVKIIDETVFPIECMANDPTAKVIIDKMGVSIGDVKDIANSVVSIKVQGIKPK